MYAGETVDMTYEPRWRPAVVLPGRDIALTPETGTLARIVREFPPLRILPRGERTWIVDFGQNCTGVVRLELDEPRGTCIVVRHAEDLRKDGGLMTGSLKSAACTDRVVCPGGSFVFQPRFTFRGFRYIEIAGISSAPKPEQLRKIALSSITRQTLELDFAHSQFDRLFEMIRWTQLSNWLSVPMDCPQRGERLGWLGDNQLFAPSGLMLFDGCQFQSKHLDDIFHAAHENGAPPDMAPCGGGAPPLATYGWADGAVTVPHAIWKIYGDIGPARRHWAAIRKYLFSLDASGDADGLVVHGTYGDWLTTETKTRHPIMAPICRANVLENRNSVRMSQVSQKEFNHG